MEATDQTPTPDQVPVIEDPRVTLARDVIAQLTAGRLLAERMVYVSIDRTLSDKWMGADKLDLREAFSETRVCAVCAKGALFVAKVRRFNNVSNRDVSGPARWRSMRECLPEFSWDQLDLMEAAFEGMYPSSLDEVALAASASLRSWTAYDFYKKWRATNYQNPDWNCLLTAIMQNVVDNGGDFVP